MDGVTSAIQEKLRRLKYNYQLLFHPEKIEIPEGLSKKDREKRVRQIYLDKAKLHQCLGAKQFQKFIMKFDSYKYKFLKKVIGEERVLKYSDASIEKWGDQQLKKVKSPEEQQKIMEEMKRAKIQVRNQLKEERSSNYWLGVDRRIVEFPKYLISNKRIHQACLVRNGIILGGCMIGSFFGLPLVPLVVLGGYQIIAGFKNLQCINNQEYGLARYKAMEKAIVKRNMRQMKKEHDENQDLIKDIRRAREAGKSLDNLDDILNCLTTIESVKQFRKLLVQGIQPGMVVNLQSQNLEASQLKMEHSLPRETDKTLEELIAPPLNQTEEKPAVAVKK